MQARISPASAITGAVVLPGDKSISHRYAMIAAIAEGETRIRNYATGADCHSTLACIRALGVDVEGAGTEFAIRGKGLDCLREPAADLDAGNSGSTIRMLSGILAGQPFVSRIFGDESLSKRRFRCRAPKSRPACCSLGSMRTALPPLPSRCARAITPKLRFGSSERISPRSGEGSP
jgi:3-phosphoshikimate 1-carboxyvinyltransferase